MTRVAKSARITISGDSRKRFDEANVAQNAWEVWRVALKAAKQRGVPADRSGVPGFDVALTMQGIVASTFPELNAEPDLLRSVAATVRNHLRTTGNAVCVNRDKTAVRWWIRETWNDQPIALVHGGLIPTNRERKLTPHEAGEDRAPAPVEVRKVDPTGTKLTDEEAAIVTAAGSPNGLNFQDAKRIADEHDTCVLAALRELGEPASTTEIVTLCEIGDRGSARNSIKRLLGRKVIRELTPAQAGRPKLKSGAKYYAAKWWKLPTPAAPVAPTPKPEPKVVPLVAAGHPVLDPVGRARELVNRNAELERENAELRSQLAAIERALKGES